MSRPLYRGLSEMRIADSIYNSWDSQMKDRTEKENLDIERSPEHPQLSLKLHGGLLPLDNSPPPIKNDHNENGFLHELFNSINLQLPLKFTLFLVRSSLFFIIIIVLMGSFWWTISISTLHRGNVYHGYRQLQEQVVSELWDIGEFSMGSALKELEFCPPESENHVPCFSVSENLAMGHSDGEEYDRHCIQRSQKNCLVYPPRNYRIPLPWPMGRDVIWVGNVKITAQEVLSSGSLTKRMMMLEDDQISFRSDSLMFDGVEDYSHQIADMMGLRNESSFNQAGVRTILDIGCGYGSIGAHLFSNEVLTMCIANYEASGSQVQLTLERGLPAMIGSFTSKQLPYPSLSFDMLHCARCGIDWDRKDGLHLIEADRILRPGGYFVWTSPLTNALTFRHNKRNQKRWTEIHTFADSLCWEMLSQQEETVVWKKSSKKNCYISRKPGSGPPICSKGQDVETPYYRPLQKCIGGTHSRHWIPIEQRATWPSRAHLSSTDLARHGLCSEDIAEDTAHWKVALQDYWSLLSPVIFSDHPKRPGDEDPSAPYNMVRNVLDMNAHFGGFSSALLNAKKSVWVMNVVPTSGPNHLPLILDRGFIGLLHDWCEAFPSYPRTYDMIHAEGLLSLESKQQRCTLLDLFTEVDRLLRPEGWVILRDTASLIEIARVLSTRLKWDVRIVELESSNDEKLLICQKPFSKRQSSSSDNLRKKKQSS